MTSVAVRVCPSVSVGTHGSSVAVHQYTYQHVCPWTQHADPSHIGPWTQHADPSRGLFGTHMSSMAVHQYTYQHVGPWTRDAGPSRGLFG
ncbi:unnamed protein product [Brassica rapa]|uniref:Uncharacterized protein n=1 Tax=Brassica campestris TaxID=3711 RepID=A0A8D9G6X7_BRACM|nr:unnamed protein product [Brassica rapa]